MPNLNHNFGRCIELLSFSLYNQDPFLEDIQIGHIKCTTHTNRPLKVMNHIVFMNLTDEKKNTISNYLYF